MKKILLAMVLIPSIAYASEEEFDCHKNHTDHAVECTAKKDGVSIKRIEMNGGSCSSPIDLKIHHKIMNHNEKFTVPGSKECGYVSGVTVYTHSGKIQLFQAM